MEAGTYTSDSYLRPEGDASHAPPTAPWSLEDPVYRRRRWSLAAANRYCLGLTNSHYENFPVAMSLFSKQQQEALAAIYAFARTADDFADEDHFEGMRERLLDEWERQLEVCRDTEVGHPVFIALGNSMRRFELPIEPFFDLLDAFRQDCRQRRYETFSELLDYCRRSANPVGRLVLNVLGLSEPGLAKWSDSICTALQLTNHWQDISVDTRRNRIYIPREDLDRFRVHESTLLTGNPSRLFGDLVVFEANRTRELFRQGRRLLINTGFPGNVYFTAVWMGGRAVLRMVRRTGKSIIHERPVLNAYLFARTLVGAGLSRLTGSAA
ncbi:MAG TPA: squalene synthase HpnC [Myxococcota bacterium]|nr:squalene synthase HpnC [Myxococcota bacterium]